jgi:hypothetical protein
VHAAVIEAVPTLALGVFAIACEIGLAVVRVGDVMLARQEEHLLVGRFDDLIGALILLIASVRVALGSGFGGR